VIVEVPAGIVKEPVEFVVFEVLYTCARIVGVNETGVTLLLAELAGPVPVAFVARTVNV
jgi:hypothetical protein